MVTVGISISQPIIINIKMKGQAHFTHFPKGIRAISSTPINTPEVGVIKFVKPSPIWNAVTVACFDKLTMSDISDNMGIINAALAVPDVISALSKVWNPYINERVVICPKPEIEEDME